MREEGGEEADQLRNAAGLARQHQLRRRRSGAVVGADPYAELLLGGLDVPFDCERDRVPLRLAARLLVLALQLREQGPAQRWPRQLCRVRRAAGAEGAAADVRLEALRRPAHLSCSSP